MSTIGELKKSLHDMTQEELITKLREIRTRRSTPAEVKTKTKRQKKTKDPLENLSQAELLALVEALKGG
jgi:hypothetical protein